MKNLQDGIQRTMKIFTDSENAITDMKSGMYPSTKNVLENNIDLQMELKNVRRTSVIKYKLIHVKAHQDEQIAFHDLPMEAQLNSLVNEYAGGVCGDESCGQHNEEVQFFKALICSSRFPFSRPVSNVYNQLISIVNGYASEEQLSRFWTIDMKWLCNIEWDALKVVVRRMRGAKSGNLCKIVNKQLPTMSMMHRNGLGLTKICPLCRTEVEDWNHVFRCQSQIARVERGIQLGELRKALQVQKNHPIYMQRIMALLYQWTGSYEINVPPSDSNLQELNLTFMDQCTLDVGNMFAGVLTHKFGDIQAKQYEQMDNKATRFTKKEWNVHVIRLLVKYSEAIWKNRYTYLHEESKLTMEHLTRDLAMKLRDNLLQHLWKLRIEDKGQLRSKKSFFRKTHVRNLNGRIERILISMNIAQQHENALRQDIRKWMIIPENGYTKVIKYPILNTMRKYEQLTLHRCLQVQTESHSSTNSSTNAIVVSKVNTHRGMITQMDRCEQKSSETYC